MITYLKKGRRRPPPASLTLRPRSASATEAVGWCAGLALSGVLTTAAKEGILALFDAYSATGPARWFAPDAVAIAALVALFLALAVAFKVLVGKAMAITVARERRRGLFASDLDAGPGLRGHTRL